MSQPQWIVRDRPCRRPIAAWNIVHGGFRQNEGYWCGSLAVWRDLIERFPRPDMRTEFRSWDDDVEALANLIEFLQPLDAPPVVNLFGYSWGGYSAVMLARQLMERGIPVWNLVLCDAVYRHFYHLGQWRAFAPWSTIVIPRNVRRVEWFVQRQNWPRGHRLVAADPKLEIPEPIVLEQRHAAMDEAPEYAMACGRAVWDVIDRLPDLRSAA